MTATERGSAAASAADAPPTAGDATPTVGNATPTAGDATPTVGQATPIADAPHSSFSFADRLISQSTASFALLLPLRHCY
ncbi:hypothetical protein LSTR_LSTR010635 [Laodelphax striatellus]|uniref:Uncharacterized protein n=1 Tax=Laodelphax striatellus TaxID=195883 RepID=A0A482XAL3_LAOST|nr:hypothetical protein LSTR_LSTR010635 [Laodelphax striatellus]